MIEKKNFYINGKWVAPVKPNDFDVIDPSTEEAFAVISLGSIEDTDKAVSAAKVAFETWRETSKEERVKLLEKFCEIYNRRWDEMVEAQSMEMGAPLDFASDIHTKMGADISRNTIDILKSFFGGLFVNLLNVKAIVFFVSLFGGIINVMTLSDMVATSLYFFLATALWFIILSISLAYGKKFFISEKFQKIIKQFSSLSLMIIGVALGVYVWT